MNDESARPGALPNQTQPHHNQLVRNLLADIAAFIRKYVVVSESQCLTLALWVLHTHTIDTAHTTPYLSITSAEKECGKTRLLEVLALLVARPWFTGRTTPAALARKTDAERPTLLLDESDAAFKGDREYAETLRGVLNSGYRTGGKITVCVGQGTKITTRDFSTFGAKAIAGIGELPDTVASRSIPVRLKRRAPGEQVERWSGYHRVERDAAPLCEQLVTWASGHCAALEDAEPEPLEQLSDRAAECWEPLLAIADLAGADWSQRAREAALELSTANATDGAVPSRGVQVLGAMRAAISDRASIPTAEALNTINADEELPFGAWRDGRGLDARGLAKLLAPYGVRPRTVRSGDATPKGYARADLEDAFIRYLDPPPESPPRAPRPQHDADAQRESARKHSDVADVADVAPPADAAPARSQSGHDATPVCAHRTHAEHWKPHPTTRRVICWRCHPPAGMLT
jgi:hypothetical protein